MNKFLEGFVVETPDGDTIGATFKVDKKACIKAFMLNLNKSNFEFHIESGEVPDEILWKDLRRDGYDIVPLTLKLML